jgi:SAM-dependent methyltransferase
VIGAVVQQSRRTTFPTFRDPDGFCLSVGERIIRVVHPEAADRVRTLIKSDFVGQLVSEGKMPWTRVVSGAELAELREQWPAGSAIVNGALVLEHQRIGFASYPHEWSAEMLYAAGELTLEIQLRALDAGLTLKDATPTNVLFEGSQPMFVDLLSVTSRPSGVAVWPAYAQFIRTFLLPLLRYRKQGVFPHELFLGRRDGLEPEEVYRQLSLLARFSPLALQYVSVPAWLGRSHKAGEVSPQTARCYEAEQAQAIVRMLVEGLRRAFARLQPKAGRESAWSGYMLTSSYEHEAFQAKTAFVKESLAAFAAQTVLDAGCNTGHFSRLAAISGAQVVGLDYDPAVIGGLFRRSREENLPILPLVMNVARPSPPLGWSNREQASFGARAEGRFGVALMLAVVHHLTVTDGVPLPDVFSLVASLVTKGLVVEYVPPEDPMFQKIIRNKEHLISRLGQAQFEAGFAPWFTERCRLSLPQSGRVLYRLAKRP